MITIWVIYYNTSDYPGRYVLRAQHVVRDPTTRIVPDEEVSLHASLDAARASVPPGLVRMVRAPDDEPPIVETWL